MMGISLQRILNSFLFSLFYTDKEQLGHVMTKKSKNAKNFKYWYSLTRKNCPNKTYTPPQCNFDSSLTLHSHGGT